MKTWTAGTGDYAVAGNWSDGAVPVQFDQAYIPHGVVQVGSLTIPNGTQLRIVNDDFSKAVEIQLSDTTIAGSISAGTHADTSVADNQIISLHGTVTYSGVLQTFQTYGTMHVVDRDTAATLALTSAGLLSANYGTLDVSVTNLVNNGRIGGADLDAHIVTANITGTGSFGVSGNSRLLFDHAVPAGMSVAFSSNTTGAKSELQLADPAGFGAAITFFNYTSDIQLRGIIADAAAWNAGTLNVTNHGATVATLNVAGYFPKGFSVDHIGRDGAADPSSSYIHGVGLHAAVTKAWTGGTADFADGSHWSDGVAPDPGDTANFAAGSIIVDHEVVGPLIRVQPSNGNYTNALHVAFTGATIMGSFITNSIKGGALGDSESYDFTGASTLSGLIAGSQSYGIIDVKDASAPAVLTVTKDGQISSTAADLNIAVSTLDLEGKVVVSNAFGFISTASITGTGAFVITGRGTLSFVNAVPSSMNMLFAGAGAGAKLELVDPSQFAASIAGFAPGNLIELNQIHADRVKFSGGVLTISNAGQKVAALHLAGDYTHGFTVTNLDGFGYADPNSSYIRANLACFAAGASIATQRGGVAVQDLRAGDRVARAGGGLAEVVWLGHRTVDCRRHPRPWDVQPVRVAAHAFGHGKPSRTLYLSPDHAVYTGGVLIPVRYLLNGASIAQVEVDRVQYWHVELAAHDVLLAENLPCESFLDTGNRSAFANGGGVVQAHPDFARKIWQAEACAPLVLDGPRLAAAKARLLARLPRLGYAVTADPGLSLCADGVFLAADWYGPACRVTLPEGARRLTLHSRTARPAELDPASADTRLLGVALLRLQLDGRDTPLSSPRFGGGWLAAEDGLRWTTGAAALDVQGVRRVELRFGDWLRYVAASPGARRDCATARLTPSLAQG